MKMSLPYIAVVFVSFFLPIKNKTCIVEGRPLRTLPTAFSFVCVSTTAAAAAAAAAAETRWGRKKFPQVPSSSRVVGRKAV